MNDAPRDYSADFTWERWWHPLRRDARNSWYHHQSHERRMAIIRWRLRWLFR